MENKKYTLKTLGFGNMGDRYDEFHKEEFRIQTTLEDAFVNQGNVVMNEDGNYYIQKKDKNGVGFNFWKETDSIEIAHEGHSLTVDMVGNIIHTKKKEQEVSFLDKYEEIASMGKCEETSSKKKEQEVSLNDIQDPGKKIKLNSRKLVVLGLHNRDYHYDNLIDYRVNGSQLHITCKPNDSDAKTFKATHPIKQIAGGFEVQV